MRIIIIKIVALLFISICVKSFAQKGIFNPGDYTSNCFQIQNYKSSFTNDSVANNHIFKGQKIWRKVSFTNFSDKTTINSKCNKLTLIEIIKFGIGSKQLNVFSSDNFYDWKKSKLSANEILKALRLNDTVVVNNYNAEGELKIETEIVSRVLKENDIKGYLLKEDWLVNSYSGKSEKYIIALAPIVIDKITTESKPLFWLYYKEWENLFSCFEAQNQYSYEVLTFADIFKKRLFTSQIVKANNIFDRDVNSVNHGEDAYLENELIKEKLHNSESDLFEY